jgi:uncharacterized membrane protein
MPDTTPSKKLSGLPAPGWTWEREAAGGVVSAALSLIRIWNREARTMQQRLYWLDYDAVALAVLVIGMGMIALLALII